MKRKIALIPSFAFRSKLHVLAWNIGHFDHRPHSNKLPSAYFKYQPAGSKVLALKKSKGAYPLFLFFPTISFK